ncbi:hypothetical protein ACFQ3S_01345 [Mucilaginibacter terrae]|uniref:hypothetical protein n=1 Tax=Mucilaginibacter terrae TaxID=1955052 RepID=UPI0036397B05
MYGFVFDGIYQYSDFNQQPNGSYVIKDEVPAGNGVGGQTPLNVQPGDPKYRDINGDGLINANDQTIIGNPYPIHVGGINNNFTYKSFDLNVFFQWSYGNQTYNANRIYLEGGTSVGLNTNQFATYANRWTPDNPSNELYRANAIGTSVYSTRFLEDASFIRLKTMQLGYTLPAKLINRIGLRTLRLYTSAQNLYTWTKYSSTDPENSTRGNGVTAGYDFSAYPRALTVTFGLNLTL